MGDEYAGLAGRECGEHRTTGRRAWCFDCSESCYPGGPCKGCERPVLLAEVERLRAQRDECLSVMRQMVQDSVDEENEGLTPEHPDWETVESYLFPGLVAWLPHVKGETLRRFIAVVEALVDDERSE